MSFSTITNSAGMLDMEYRKILSVISKKYNEILCNNLIGIYVHGSIAFRCFSWDRSDIDFIVIIENPISQQIKLQLLHILEDLSKQAPEKGFEMSIVLKRYSKHFLYPTPYELHFSNNWRLDRYLKNPTLLNDEVRTDYDLAAHFMVINNVGVVLCGELISEVFGDVPSVYYLDSICKDIENAIKDVSENPVYVILNLCRVYAYIKDGAVLSKEKGGQWGMANLSDKYHSLIASMIDNYINGTPIFKNESLQIDFCEYMLELIFKRNDI